MLREAEREVKAIVEESYQRRDRERHKRIQTLEASTDADAEEAKRLRCLQKGEAIKKNLFDKLKRI